MIGPNQELLIELDAKTEQLRQAQAALTELMTILPELVRLADRKGVDVSEEHWLDRARTYIDIYEGRSNNT